MTIASDDRVWTGFAAALLVLLLVIIFTADIDMDDLSPIEQPTVSAPVYNHPEGP